jgi:hypothetical protein
MVMMRFKKRRYRRTRRAQAPMKTMALKPFLSNACPSAPA